jgi:hypothetical protein
MALTFEYIRRELTSGSAADLDRLFRSPEMRELSRFVEPRLKQDGRLGARISAYEKAATDPSFATQHRYGLVSDTWTGVIHIVSLFYAFLRCAAADDAGGAEQRAEAREVARKLKALATAADELVETCQKSDLLQTLKDEAWDDPVLRAAHAKAVIEPLMNAYRNG